MSKAPSCALLTEVAIHAFFCSFEKYCHYSYDPDTGHVRDCISDEVSTTPLSPSLYPAIDVPHYAIILFSHLD